MQPDTPLMAQSTTFALSQNRVLRNTYLLLAITMVPTILGAWLGVQMQFALLATNPILGIFLFLGIAFGFFFAINKTKNSPWGVVLLLGFTFFMGLMLSQMLGAVLQKEDGWKLIGLAFGGTAVIFATMATLAGTIKRDLSGFGKFLTVGVVMLIIAWIAVGIFQVSGMIVALSLIGIVIFSGFMLYDVNRIVTGGETNYILATLSLYLDIFNVFQNLLALLGFANND